MKGIVADIVMKDNVTPVAQPMRKTAAGQVEMVDELVSKLCHSGIIEKVTSFSKWQSPVLFVKRKDGQFRPCVDLRVVNDSILRQPRSFPSFEQLTMKLHGAVMFSKLDIAQAFHQIELNEDHRDYTTFCTNSGTYRYTRLTFGLANAPELFQRAMEFVLKDLVGFTANSLQSIMQFWSLDKFFFFASCLLFSG